MQLVFIVQDPTAKTGYRGLRTAAIVEDKDYRVAYIKNTSPGNRYAIVTGIVVIQGIPSWRAQNQEAIMMMQNWYANIAEPCEIMKLPRQRKIINEIYIMNVNGFRAVLKKGSKRFKWTRMLTFSAFKKPRCAAVKLPPRVAMNITAMWRKGLLRNRDFCKEGTTKCRYTGIDGKHTTKVVITWVWGFLPYMRIRQTL